MKKLLFLPVLVSLFITLQHPAASAQKARPKKTTAAVKYQCPMKCEGDKTYSKKGTCPECGMTLKQLPVKK